MARELLPIDSELNRIYSKIEERLSVIILAEPGAGKSTRVPCLAFQKQKKWALLQPRRWAARSVAARIAEENGIDLGAEVGFQIRGENRTSSKTKLVVMTEGVLIQKLIRDPELSEFEGIILDEFHERSLDLDLSLALLKELQETFRPDLKMVVMSATLDPVPLLNFLPSSELIEVKGRMFPVEKFYRPEKDMGRGPNFTHLINVVEEALHHSSLNEDGDVLVFLPGAREIDDAFFEAKRRFSALKSIELLRFHGSLPEGEQKKVFEAPRAQVRRIIFSTNICETSITLPRIRAVVDTGLAKVMRTDTQMGQDRLETVRISLASANQRAGRAGRVAPGVCYRIWSEGEHTQLRSQETPEVHRVSLSESLLTLASLGVRKFDQFEWFEKPSRTALQFWTQDLVRLGMLDENGFVTELGKKASSLPVSPAFAKLLVESSSKEAATQNLFHWALRFLVWKEWGASRNSGAVEKIQDLSTWIKQMNSVLDAPLARAWVQPILARFSNDIPKCEESEWPLFLRLLLRSHGQDFFVNGKKVGGRQVVPLQGQAPLPSYGFLLASNEFRDSKNNLSIRAVHYIPLDREFVQQHTSKKRSVKYEESLQRIRAEEGLHFFDIPMGSQTEVKPLPEEVKQIWGELILPNPPQFFSRLESHEAFMSRVNFWNQNVEHGIIKEDLRVVLPWEQVVEFYSGDKTRLSDWEEVNLEEVFRSELALLNRELPTHIEVPTGTRVRVQYGSTMPKISVRLQEVFGWLESPKVLQGKIPVLMELLSPGFKPIQLTQDLRSFWNGAYFEVRKELRARYPKHSWPEDPLSARPEAKGRHKFK